MRKIRIRPGCLLQGELVGDRDEVLEPWRKPRDAVQVEACQLHAGNPLLPKPGGLFPGGCERNFSR